MQNYKKRLFYSKKQPFLIENASKMLKFYQKLNKIDLFKIVA